MTFMLHEPPTFSIYSRPVSHVPKLIELLVVNCGTEQYGLRINQIAGMLNANRCVWQDRVGRLEPQGWPVVRLNDLLGTSIATENKSEQIIAVNTLDGSFGLWVEAALQVVRVEVRQLVPLPVLVECNRLRKAAYALWLRPNDEPLVLLDPTELGILA